LAYQTPASASQEAWTVKVFMATCVIQLAPVEDMTRGQNSPVSAKTPLNTARS
jgi:hypothetical protein